MNTLTIASDVLALVHHEALLTKILEALHTTNPFQAVSVRGTASTHLFLDADSIALPLARDNASSVAHFVEKRLHDPQSATLNLSSRDEMAFVGAIKKIQDQLDSHLDAVAAGRKMTVGDVAASLVTPTSALTRRNAKALGFYYDLKKRPTLKRQRLRFDAGADTSKEALLRWHRLKITVALPKDFNDQIEANLRAYVDRQFPSLGKRDRDDMEDILAALLENPTSDVTKLKRIIRTETVGQLKKEARIRYLAYLETQMDVTGRPRRHVAEMVRRLKMVQDYVHDTGRNDDAYRVTYRGQEVNLKAELAASDAFDVLPLIPLIEGSAGETTDDRTGEQSYIFGMKLKLNGAIARRKQTSFEYHCDMIEGKTEARADKVLRALVLYYILFSSFEKEGHDPIAALENDILPRLRAGNDTDKARVLAVVATKLRASGVQGTITETASALRTLVKRAGPMKQEAHPVHINVLRGILETDKNTILKGDETLFRDVFSGRHKEALAYIEVGGAHVSDDALCAADGRILFEDIRCFEVRDGAQSFSMAYDADDRRCLLVVLRGSDEASRAAAKTAFLAHNSVVIKVDAKDVCDTLRPEQWFIYRYVVTLLSYLSLRRLAASIGPDVFVPIMRLHNESLEAGAANDENDFARMLSKTLAHLLSADYLSNAQGYNLASKESAEWRIGNTLSSLYSVLPKTFAPMPSEAKDGAVDSLPYVPTLDRMALVVVSSRESDGVRADVPTKRTTIYGEVIGIDRQPDGSVQVRRIRTFAGNADCGEIYTNPTALLDEVHKLYEDGYHHVVYMAKSPYSSTLRLTSGEEDDTLFFMSRAIISRIRRQNPRLKLYPVFCDKYYVIKITQPAVDSLYIQDTLELTRVVEDPGKQLVVFLNLFNGKSIRGITDRAYNGVISYATPLNMYEGILDDRDIRDALLHDQDGANALKNDIVYYLTLFHFARYEADRQQIVLKLDPYESIIGDDSVGALAARHGNMFRGVTFNFLSFLTLVRQIVVEARPVAAAGEAGVQA